MTNRLTHAAWLLACGIGLMLTSCTKETAYDDLTKTDGIDLNINIAKNGLTLPLGSTDKVYLTELINPDDSENIFIGEDGKYHVRKFGEMDSSSIDIKAVHTDMITQVEDRKFTMTIENEWTPSQQMFFNSMKEGDLLSSLGDLSNMKIATDNIYLGSQTERTHFEIKSNDADKSIIELKAANFSNPLEATYSITLSNLPNPDSIYDILIKDIKIVLPPYIIAKSSKTGKIYENATLDDFGEGADNRVVVRKNAGTTTAEWTSPVIQILGADFSANILVNNNGNVYQYDTLLLQASAEIEHITLFGSDLKIGAKDANGNNTVVYKDKVTVGTVFTVSAGEMTSVLGRFYPNIDPFEKNIDIDMLNEDLDFLRDNNVVMDIKNPRVTIHGMNDCDIRITADASIDSHNGNPIVFKDILLTPEAGTDSMTIILTANESDPSNGVYSSPALSTILQPVPDSIFMHMDVFVDSTVTSTLLLGHSYHISCDYNVDVPFDFNSISISYDEEIEDVFSDDITDYISEVKDAVISMEVCNTVPLDFNLKVIARNQNGEEDESLIKYNAPKIKAGSLSDPQSTNIEMAIDISNIGEIKDIILRAEGSGSDCELNANQYLQMKDIKLTIKDINLDLNDK